MHCIIGYVRCFSDKLSDNRMSVSSPKYLLVMTGDDTGCACSSSILGRSSCFSIQICYCILYV